MPRNTTPPSERSVNIHPNIPPIITIPHLERSVNLHPNIPPIITILPSERSANLQPNIPAVINAHQPVLTSNPETERNTYLQGLDDRTRISRPVYNNLESPNLSPTYSSMNLELFVLEKPFEPNKILLNEEFNSKKNTKIRTWFFKNFKTQAIDIKNEYYNYLHQIEENMFFFDWLENHFLPPKEISVIDKIST